MIWKITKMWRDKIKPRKQTVTRIVSQIYKIRVSKLTQSEKLLLANSQQRVSTIDSTENKPTDTSYMSKLKHWKITAAKHETNTFKLYFIFHPFVCCAVASGGNDQWPFLWTSSVNFCNTCSLSSSQTCWKTRQTNIHFFFWRFSYRFRKFGATRTSKPFCNIKVNVVVA